MRFTPPPPALFMGRHQRLKHKTDSSSNVSMPLTPPTLPKLSRSSSASTASDSTASEGDGSTTATDGEVDLGFSFAGGGWLMCYMFGVAKALRKAGLHHNARFIGTSAGALAAIGLTLDADFDAICNTVTSNYIARARSSWRGPFQMREYLTHALTTHANLHDYRRCDQEPRKCTVVYTSLSKRKARKKSSFESQEHLLKTLIASCCATPFVGMPFKFEGEWVMDGGIVENQPEFDASHEVKRTVRVSPNCYDTSADIRPSRYVPPWWSLYPPTREELQWVYELGHHDGLVWCANEGYAVSSPKPIAQRPRSVRVSRKVSGRHDSARSLKKLLSTLKSSMPLRTRPSIHHTVRVNVVMILWICMAIASVWSLVKENASRPSIVITQVAVTGFLHLAIWLPRLHRQMRI